MVGLKGRQPDTKLKVIGAAYWMKGCRSLGRARFAVLLAVGSKRHRQYCLIDLKEATAAAAPRSEDFHGSQADRVVAGARNLSPYLGDRMMAVTMGKTPIVMRELMPRGALARDGLNGRFRILLVPVTPFSDNARGE